MPDINRAKFGFRPDVEQNEIIYGLKPVVGVGAKIANTIIKMRPYKSATDFYEKMLLCKELDKEAKFGDVAMIQLIKAGAFDVLEKKPREEIMADFIRYISKPIKTLHMSNIEELDKMSILSPANRARELRFYRFKKYLYQNKFLAVQSGKSPATAFYRLDRKFAEPFFNMHFVDHLENPKDYYYDNDGYILVKRGSLDKLIDKLTEDFKKTVLNNPEVLKKVNERRFQEVWDEKASGTISKWEMDSLNYYYHEHELAHIQKETYNIVDFEQLPEEPEIVDTYFYRGQGKPRYKLSRICGTVIDKNKDHGTVTLLTPDGVITVRFYKGQFGFYDKEISTVLPDGSKKKLEKSWFQRGSKIMVTGFRSGEMFIPKKYNDSLYRHTVQLIKEVNSDGSVVLQSDRIDVDKQEEKLIAI